MALASLLFVMIPDCTSLVEEHRCCSMGVVNGSMLRCMRVLAVEVKILIRVTQWRQLQVNRR